VNNPEPLDEDDIVQAELIPLGLLNLEVELESMATALISS
jgi:hypothetical protein